MLHYSSGRRAAIMCLVVLTILTLSTRASIGRAAGLQSVLHARASSFHGSCYSYRAALWKFTQATADDQTLWWTALQTDYHGDYPPRPGGSVPGMAEQQSNAEAMRGIEYSLIGNKGNDPHAFDGGIGNQATNVADQYGTDSSQATPYGWAINELVITVSDLAEAAIDEAQQYGSGLGSFHDSQAYLTYTWQALNQLPCKPAAPKPPKSPASQPSRPSPAVTVGSSAPLSALTIQLSDLRPGYIVDSAGYVKASDVTSGLHFGSKTLVAHGWIASYSAQFSRDAGSIEVGDYAHQFRTALGAQWMFNLDLRVLPSWYQTTPMPRLAAASTGFEGKGLVGLLFRRGAYVVSVFVSSRLAGASQTVVALARLVDGRLQRGVPSPASSPGALPSTSLFVGAWVSPSSMPYDFYPTLYAKSVRGATCSASVVYSTGRSPVSFSGYPRTVGNSGTVSWSWHEETKGSGGNGSVTCSLGGRMGTAVASFTVVH